MLAMSVGLKSLLAFVSAVLVLAGSLAGAGAAAADSIQVQSYQRASATAACVAQPGETPWQANWGTDASWKPSWEQWANTGKGGWVCTRSITWAITPAPAGVTPVPVAAVAGCVLYSIYNTFAVDFNGTNFTPAGSSFYTDTTCSYLIANQVTAWPLAYAASIANAEAICSTRVPGTSARDNYWAVINIYTCQ